MSFFPWFVFVPPVRFKFSSSGVEQTCTCEIDAMVDGRRVTLRGFAMGDSSRSRLAVQAQQDALASVE